MPTLVFLCGQTIFKKYSNKIICTVNIFYVCYFSCESLPCVDIQSPETSAGHISLGCDVGIASKHGAVTPFIPRPKLPSLHNLLILAEG